MKYIKSLTLILSTLLLNLACTEQLDLNPISNISGTSFWQTPDDATGAVNGMYARMRNVTARNLYIWGESRSQILRQSVGNDQSNLRNFNNTLDPTAAGPDWSSLYKVVADANLILKNVPGIGGFAAEGNRNRLLAEAYTMRAYCYFVMARTWGAVPLVTAPTDGYDPSVIYKTRSTLTEVFAQIKKDLDQAISLFPNNDFLSGRSRWTKPGANTLKGDVYLWTGKRLGGGAADFTTALNALKEVENADVALLSDFSRIFDYDNKGNKEIIMASNFTRFETNGTFMSFMYADSYPAGIDPKARERIGAIGGANYWTLTDETRNKFTETDQRKDATFVTVYTADAATGKYTKFYADIQKKFDGLVEAGTRLFLDDVVIYRYADVLLLKAEAQNALGQDPSEAMNQIRKRAYGADFKNHTFVNGSKAQNDDLILRERLLEFLYEGKYWWDVLRFDKATELVPYFRTNPGDKYKYLWPLSLSILSLEPETVQNPGY